MTQALTPLASHNGCDSPDTEMCRAGCGHFKPLKLRHPVYDAKSGWLGMKPSQPKWCLFGVCFWRVPKRFWRNGWTLETRLEHNIYSGLKRNRLTGKNLQKRLSRNPCLPASS